MEGESFATFVEVLGFDDAWYIYRFIRCTFVVDFQYIGCNIGFLSVGIDGYGCELVCARIRWLVGVFVGCCGKSLDNVVVERDFHAGNRGVWSSGFDLDGGWLADGSRCWVGRDGELDVIVDFNMTKVDFVDVAAAACDVEVEYLLACWERYEQTSAEGAVGVPVVVACLRNGNDVGECFEGIACVERQLER